MVTISSTGPSSVTIASSIALRLRFLAGRIHALGPRPLFEIMCELSGSSTALDRFEAYAAMNSETLNRFGGRELPPAIRLIK